MSTSLLNQSAHLDPNVSAIIVECILEGTDAALCNGTLYQLPEPLLGPKTPMFWVYLSVYIFLVLFGGLMAGLVLAIMSIDGTSLKVVIAAGTPSAKKHAKRIAPFVRRHHLALVTLVLANAAAVESMPIFLDRISDPITAVLVSSTAVLIFGELVWGLIGLFFPIAWPFSNLLDFVLGREHNTFYRRKELQALVDIHGCVRIDEEKGHKHDAIWCMGGGKEVKESKGIISSERLSYDEVVIIKGALEMSSKKARHAMVPLPEVYMLHIDCILDENLVREIFEMGHSRVPVYTDSRDNVLGVFLTKRLITIDPKQNIPLKKLIQDNPAGKTLYPTFCVDQDVPLYELLNRFQIGLMTHMAFVTAQKPETNTQELVGIVTLEDVIEELLQEEIYDEADVSRSKMGRRLQLAKAKMILTKKYSVTSSVVSATPDFVRRQSVPIMEQTEIITEHLTNGHTNTAALTKTPSGGVLSLVYQE